MRDRRLGITLPVHHRATHVAERRVAAGGYVHFHIHDAVELETEPGGAMRFESYRDEIGPTARSHRERPRDLANQEHVRLLPLRRSVRACDERIREREDQFRGTVRKRRLRARRLIRRVRLKEPVAAHNVSQCRRRQMLAVVHSQSCRALSHFSKQLGRAVRQASAYFPPNL